MKKIPELTTAEYDEYLPIWRKCGDVLKPHAVKAARETYLPKTAGMLASEYGEADYQAYLFRARVSSVASDALDGALGVMFANAPNGADEGEPVTNTGLDAESLAREVARAVYAKGRHVLVVDAPTEGGEAYIVQYQAESMPYIETDENENLTAALFVEKKQTGEPFKREEITVYRAYTPDGITVYSEAGDIIEQYPPLIAGELPVFIIGAIDNSPSCDTPPMERIADCVLSAYRISADYLTTLYLSSVVTPWVKGVSEDVFHKIRAAGIGPGTIWHLGEAGGDVGFLEFSGQAAQALKTAIDDELAQAAQYSIKLVDVGAGIESAEAKAIRDRAQKSGLQTIADSISQGMTAALSFRARVNGQTEPEPFEINPEESQSRAEAQMLTALGAQINAGNLPPTVLYDYAVESGLFSGTIEEWNDAKETVTAAITNPPPPQEQEAV